MRDPGAGWTVLVLELPEELEAELAGSLGSDSLGTQTTPLGAGKVCLRVYVATPGEADSLLDRARQSVPACDARVEPVADLRWAEAYQAGLLPFPIGDGFLVVPDGRAHPEPGRTPLRLVPGRAFGTGDHPTTRMCVAALERRVEPGSSWLDLGCGTGILALVAAHRGAARVLGRDDDPEAIEVATEVIAANPTAGRVELAVGSADDLAGSELDGVVANIASPYFLTRTHAAAAVLRDGGVLIAAGILASESGEIADCFGRAGLSVIERDQVDGWALLIARRCRD